MTNDPSLTLSSVKLEKRAQGDYRYVNRATRTTWNISRRGEGTGEGWVFIREDGKEGGQDVFRSRQAAIGGLVAYLRHRVYDRVYGWTTG